MKMARISKVFLEICFYVTIIIIKMLLDYPSSFNLRHVKSIYTQKLFVTVCGFKISFGRVTAFHILNIMDIIV